MNTAAAVQDPMALWRKAPSVLDTIQGYEPVAPQARDNASMGRLNIEMAQRCFRKNSQQPQFNG
jgi:hypothetical protein